MAEDVEQQYVTVTENALNDHEINSLGLVAAEWGYAESILETLIWRLARIDTLRGRSITAYLASETRQHIAKTLVNETLSNSGELVIREEILAAIGQFEELRERRNKIVHAHWKLPESFASGGVQPTLAEAVARIMKAKDKIDVKEQTFDPLAIRDTALDITNLVVRFHQAMKMLPDAPETAKKGLAKQFLRPT